MAIHEPMRIKVFVSSPSDVSAERARTLRVLAQVELRYRGQIKFDAVYWEHLPIASTGSFQEGIEPPSESDLAIFILWSRMGSPLPDVEKYRNENGRVLTGTEWEYFDALAEHDKSKKPHMMVYRKTAPVPLMYSGKRGAVSKQQNQVDAVEAFFTEQFHDSDGAFSSAYHSFPDTEAYEAKLERQITHWVVDRLTSAGIIAEVDQWEDSPFRGLRVFEEEHAPIFFGRNVATQQVLNALEEQVAANKGFVLVLGSSGSGKSSLMRAGVSPRLNRPGVIDGRLRGGRVRRAVFRPGDDKSPYESLLTSLVVPAAVPELEQHLRDDQDLKLDTLLGRTKTILQPPAREHEVPIEDRLVVFVDQFEELFASSVTPQERQRFFGALSALATSGFVWVLATLRNDHYAQFQEAETMVGLLGEHGRIDLGRPTDLEIAEIIKGPADAAGLSLEIRKSDGRRLIDVIQDDAKHEADSLPLLEYTLHELYLRRDGTKLTWKAYEDMGGVRGAIAKRADAVFAGLSNSERAAFAPAMQKLVEVGTDDRPKRRRVPHRTLAAVAGDGFIETFVDAHLFTTDAGPDGEPVVGAAHEALFRNWPKLSEWVDSNRDHLTYQRRLRESTKRWLESDKSPDLVLPPGKSIDEVNQLVASGFALDPEEEELLTASKKSASWSKNLKRGAIVALALLAAGMVYMWIRAEGESERARNFANQEKKARGSAEELIDYMLFELRDGLKPLGKLELLGGPAKKALAYYDENKPSIADHARLRRRSAALINVANVLQLEGSLVAARMAALESLKIARALVKVDTRNALWQRDLAVSLDKVGELQHLAGNGTKALASIEESLSIMRALVNRDESNWEWQHGLASRLHAVGDFQRDAGNSVEALASFRESLAIMRGLVKQDKSNKQWHVDLVSSISKVGDLQWVTGNGSEALARHEESLAIMRALVKQDDSNKEWQQNLAACLHSIGDLQRANGNRIDALRSHEESVAVMRALVKHDSSNRVWQSGLAGSISRVGKLQRTDGKFAEALASLEECLTIRRQLAKYDEDNTMYQEALATCLSIVGDLQWDASKRDEALSSFEESLAIRRTLVKQDGSNSRRKRNFSTSLIRIGALLREMGKDAESLECLKESLAISRTLVKQDEGNSQWLRDLSISLYYCAVALSSSGAHVQAHTHMSEAISVHASVVNLTGRMSGEHDWLLSEFQKIKAAAETASKSKPK